MMWNKIQTLMIGVPCGSMAIALLGVLIWAARFEPVVPDPDANHDLKIETTSQSTTLTSQNLSMNAMAAVWQKNITPPKPKPISKPVVRQPVAVRPLGPPLRMKLLGVAFHEDKPQAILQIDNKTLVMNVGDVVQGAQLIEVGPTYVRVNQAGRDVRLQLQLP